MIRTFVAVCIFLSVFAWAAPSEAQSSGARRVLVLWEQPTEISGWDTALATRSLQAPFVKVGFSVVAANKDAAPVDSSAEALKQGKAAGASVVVVVRLEAKKDGALQSTLLRGAVATMRFGIYDIGKSNQVIHKQIQRAGYGGNSSKALAMAAERSLESAVSEVELAVLRYWPKAISVGNVLALQVLGATSWREVGSLLRTLATIPGIGYVHVLDIREGRIHFRLASQQSIASVVSSLRRTRIHEGSISVRGKGATITCTFQMNANTTDPVNNG